MLHRIVLLFLASAVFVFVPVVADELRQRQEGTRDTQREHPERDRPAGLHRPDRDENARPRLDDARRRDDQIRDAKHRLRDEWLHRDSQQRRSHQDLGHLKGRLEHAIRAAEHLHEAGMDELAERVEHQAEQWERQIDEQMHHGSRQNDQVRKLVQEVAELREQVQQLRKQIKP